MSITNNTFTSNRVTGTCNNTHDLGIGNIVPHWWYKAIRAVGDKADLVAITVLTELYSLQRTDGEPEYSEGYAYLERKFDFTRNQLKDALTRLDEAGLATRSFRTIVVNGRKFPNELHLKINMSKLLELKAKYAPRTHSSSSLASNINSNSSSNSSNFSNTKAEEFYSARIRGNSLSQEREKSSAQINNSKLSFLLVGEGVYTTFPSLARALNHTKLTTQILCISFLTIIFTLFHTSNSLANTGNYDNSSANSTKGEISHKCANELSNECIFNNDIVIGNRDAKVILIEYFAPTCTHCSEYHLKVFPELKRKYIDTGKIAYVMRECVGNKQDFDASLLARCRGDTKSYQELTNNLLLTQDSWAYSKDYKTNLYKIANGRGVSSAQYDACLKDDIKSKTLFDHAKLLASDTDFIGTPSFYINGTLFKTAYSLDGLSKAIEIQLTKKGGQHVGQF